MKNGLVKIAKEIFLTGLVGISTLLGSGCLETLTIEDVSSMGYEQMANDPKYSPQERAKFAYMAKLMKEQANRKHDLEVAKEGKTDVNIYNGNQNDYNSDAGIGRAKEVQVEPEFFVCNYWVDKNNDRNAERNEFVGEKHRFGENEKIDIVAYNISSSDGENLRVKIYAPNGELVAEKETDLPQNPSVSQTVINDTKRFVLNYGYGDYKVAFWKGAEYLGKTDFEVTN